MSELKDPLGTVEKWKYVESGLKPSDNYKFPLLFIGSFGLLIAGAVGLVLWAAFKLFG